MIHMEPGDEELLAQNTCDYMSISYYQTTVVSHEALKNANIGNFSKGFKNPYLPLSEWGWPIAPIGLKITLVNLYDRYEKPLFVVENGLGAEDQLVDDGNGSYTVHDSYRIHYLKEHIREMKESVKDGVELMGYLLWGCIDIVSCSTGEMKKRYGFIYVDCESDGSGTFNRYKKDSLAGTKK